MSSSRLVVLEQARRRVSGSDVDSPIDLLRSGASVGHVSERSGLPRAVAEGVGSFYGLLQPGFGERRCRGTACTFAGGVEPRSSSRRSDARSEDFGSQSRKASSAVYCVGRCYQAPSSLDDRSEAPIPRTCLPGDSVVLRHMFADSDGVEDYEDLPEGADLLGVLERTGLRGRGGAAYPTGAKWRAAREVESPVKYVVANGDEGDPGSYVDRLILEEAPHSVLAGMKACARVMGATHGVVFVRGEYPAAVKAMETAIQSAQDKGLLGDLSVELHVGAGSYVCGEETALLRAIEGLRAEPSVRPPYPTESGLFGLPTVVQNVETLSLIPWLAQHRRLPMRKAVCVSGAVAKPGVVEIELGTSIKDLIRLGAGGAATGTSPKMALVGGPMGRLLPASLFETELGFDSLPGMGHGGVLVFDESVAPRALFDHLVEFAQDESCGSCTPCRVGTAQLGNVRDVVALERLLETLEVGSLCGFGKGVPRPIRDLIHHFGEALFQ